MSEEEQRIAIAEICGWVKDVRRAEIPEADFVTEMIFWNKDKEVRRNGWLPDYLHDLNDMHEAENTLSQEEMIQYIVNLARVATNPSCATAKERSKALLITKGVLPPESIIVDKPATQL